MRLAWVHPELHFALTGALPYGDVGQGGIIDTRSATVCRWVRALYDIKARAGKEGLLRLAWVHPELHFALTGALPYGDVGQGGIIDTRSATVCRWVRAAVRRAVSTPSWKFAIFANLDVTHPHPLSFRLCLLCC